MEKKTLKILFVTMVFLSVAIGLVVMASMMSPSTVQTTAQTSIPIPIELEVTVEPSTIELGETSTITVRLLDENRNSTVSEIDIPVELVELHTLTRRADTVVIPAGKESVSVPYTPHWVGITTISVKSMGLISDTSSVAVMPAT